MRAPTEGGGELATKPRAARIVLAVLSSIVLTAMVVVPLAMGARSARIDDRATTDANTRTVVSTSTTVADTEHTGVPGDGSGRGSTDGVTSSSLPPRIETEVLPQTESRDGGPDVFSDVTLDESTVTTVAPPGDVDATTGREPDGTGSP